MYRHTGLVIDPKNSGTIDGAVNKTGAATLNCGMVTVWCVRLRISSRVRCLAALRSSTFVGDFSRFIASSPMTVYSPSSRNESPFCTYRQCFAPEGSCRPCTKSPCCRPCFRVAGSLFRLLFGRSCGPDVCALRLPPTFAVSRKVLTSWLLIIQGSL